MAGVAVVIGEVISGIGNLVGGLINHDSARSASNKQYDLARQNMDMQERFAKQGIRWRVNDAEKAGIHPLYALGAQTTSFSPVSAGSVADTSLGSAVASAGQDISRAMNATRTQSERDNAFAKTVQDLQLQKFGLENELLASQIQKLKSSMNPPFPNGTTSVIPDKAIPFIHPEANKPEDRPPLMLFGKRVLTSPGTSPMKAWEDQIGDDGPGSWIAQLAVMSSMLGANWPRVHARLNNALNPRGFIRGMIGRR